MYCQICRHGSPNPSPCTPLTQAWGHWGVVLLASAAGILAHGLASSVLTALHAALGFMLAAALGGYNTAFWYTLDTRCASLSQH